MFDSKVLQSMLGNYIYKSRTQLGLTQLDVAKHLGFSIQFYGRIEKGAVPIPADALAKIVHILELERGTLEKIFRTAALSTVDLLFEDARVYSRKRSSARSK